MSTIHDIRITVGNRAHADLVTAWIEEGEAREMLDFSLTVKVSGPNPPIAVAPLQALADAIPLGESDYGTPQHIDAENEFTEAVQLVLSDDLFTKFEVYALKANTSEMVGYAMQLVEQTARAQVTSEIPAAALDEVSIDLH